mgnify:CR=1 FL=1
MARIRGRLPDYLVPGLSILFVGINPGLRSSEVGHHFAGPSNRFWKLLFESGLTPYQMTCRDDGLLLDYGYGFTNLVAKPTRGLHNLSRQDCLRGRRALVAKITKFQPTLVALLGISVARTMFPLVLSTTSKKRLASDPVQTGLQSELLEGIPVFVLPNPSGRNAHYSYQKMGDIFRELKAVSLQLSGAIRR